jgi:hypothetical protein
VEESGVLLCRHNPSWFSMLVYRLVDGQYARWWPQFRISLRHDDDDDHHHHRRSRRRLRMPLDMFRFH